MSTEQPDDGSRTGSFPPEGDLRMIRHDLKNHLTAMRSGCVLLERYLAAGDMGQVRSYLQQMQQELKNGFSIVDRLSPRG